MAFAFSPLYKSLREFFSFLFFLEWPDVCSGRVAGCLLRTHPPGIGRGPVYYLGITSRTDGHMIFFGRILLTHHFLRIRFMTTRDGYIIVGRNFDFQKVKGTKESTGFCTLLVSPLTRADNCRHLVTFDDFLGVLCGEGLGSPPWVCDHMGPQGTFF